MEEEKRIKKEKRMEKNLRIENMEYSYRRESSIYQSKMYWARILSQIYRNTKKLNVVNLLHCEFNQ